jgi:hypothetical protein
MEIYDNQIRLIWGDPEGAVLSLEKGAALVTAALYLSKPLLSPKE